MEAKSSAIIVLFLAILSLDLLASQADCLFGRSCKKFDGELAKCEECCSQLGKVVAGNHFGLTGRCVCVKERHLSNSDAKYQLDRRNPTRNFDLSGIEPLN